MGESAAKSSATLGSPLRRRPADAGRTRWERRIAPPGVVTNHGCRLDAASGQSRHRRFADRYGTTSHPEFTAAYRPLAAAARFAVIGLALWTSPAARTRLDHGPRALDARPPPTHDSLSRRDPAAGPPMRSHRVGPLPRAFVEALERRLVASYKPSWLWNWTAR